MQENTHQISRAQLSFEDLQTIILEDKQIELSHENCDARLLVTFPFES